MEKCLCVWSKVMKEKVNKKELWRGKKEVETYMALQIHMKIDIFILRSDIFNQKKDIICSVFFLSML